ncbi:10008_t:CDS:2 [Dentiscutata erythropus]|uniref:10008_t:CDS:1 n=1 Tax=Dentiscutata erythropus TaxID=1348616 RepID=A0A9N9GBE2_9GLOM|nr:10008_t:CDS:2 [Dentiscutata erythropus]
MHALKVFLQRAKGIFIERKTVPTAFIGLLLRLFAYSEGPVTSIYVLFFSRICTLQWISLPNMGLTAKSYCPECDQCLITSHWCQSCQSQQFRENFDNWTSGFEEIDNFIKETQINSKDCTDYLEFFPFNSFIGINKYDNSGFGTVYSANWREGPKDAWSEAENKYVARRGLIKVALISLGKDPVIFLKELKLQYNFRSKNGLIIRLFGVTRETVTGHLMMVAETCEWDLRHYVSHHFARLTWSRKVAILHSIACAFESYQNGEQVHREQASNVQIFKSHIEIPVNELGLGETKDPIPMIGYYKNDILPYMAPEILQNKPYSVKSDIYSFGMLMWELSTNKPPFYDKTRNSKLIDYIIDGSRPVNDPHTPECYTDLMKRCWSSNPDNRPEISEIVKILGDWYLYSKNSEQFEASENIRLSKMKAKGLDTTPGRMVSPPKIHPQAIYTSRKIKFPVVPLSGISSQRIKQSYDASYKNSIDMASLLVRDESYFVKSKALETKELEEEEDDELLSQYELSIPFDKIIPPENLMVST